MQNFTPLPWPAAFAGVRAICQLRDRTCAIRSLADVRSSSNGSAIRAGRSQAGNDEQLAAACGRVAGHRGAGLAGASETAAHRGSHLRASRIPEVAAAGAQPQLALAVEGKTARACFT